MHSVQHSATELACSTVSGLFATAVLGSSLPHCAVGCGCGGVGGAVGGCGRGGEGGGKEPLHGPPTMLPWPAAASNETRTPDLKARRHVRSAAV